MIKHNLISTLTGVILPLFLSAQEQQQSPQLPVDDKTGKISYIKVNEVSGATTAVLYQRALNWAMSFYKNPGDVIRERDSVAGKIVCKARFKIMNTPDKKGFATDAGNVMYTLTLQSKDGRYRYELTDFNWKQQSYYACEKWMDKSKPSYTPEFSHYLQQLNTTSQEALKSLEKAMSTAAETKADDW